MYPIPPSETLVETKTCRHCSALFPITDKDLEFYEKVSPSFPLNRHSELVSESSAFPTNEEDPGSSPGWRNIKIEWDKVRYLIPTPTLCPDCRQQRRLSFRNERKLYKRKCDATDKDIISIYSPDKPFKVYHQDYWWSDKWDPMEYWRGFDFEKGFFEQFGEMARLVPKSGLMNFTAENCDYTNYQNDSKNCYLTFGSGYLEDCAHCKWVYYSTSVQDASFCSHGENSFENVDCHYFYKCFHCQGCENMTDCSYCYDCQNCKDCIGCVNLQNKQYCILNKQYTKEEYLLHHNKYDRKQLSADFDILKRTHPHKFCMQTGSFSCIGSELKNSKECYYSFDVEEGENIKYSSDVLKIQDSYDVNNSGLDAHVYEYVSGGYLQNILFWIMDIESNNLMYSEYCISSSHLFWCIGLRNKQYCILNKQYTREEYEALVPRIIEHMMNTPLIKGEDPKGQGGSEWGEFFPSSLSPFWYNETVAQEYYPLKREDIIPPTPLSKGGQNNNIPLSKGEAEWNGAGGFIHWPVFNWSDYEAPFPRVEKIIPADKLPGDIASIPDDILNWAIECEVTGKPFRIIKQELEFYRKHHLPIPRRHPDQRHLDRMALRNPRKLFERKCDKCGVEMITTYGPERKEIVYCEKCYNKEVIG